MGSVRKVVAYKNYFKAFLLSLDTKTQNKVFKLIEAIETLERVPSHYLKKIAGVDGLFEAGLEYLAGILLFRRRSAGNPAERLSKKIAENP